EGLIFPSKLYGIAAAGRPIVAITSKAGEIAQLVSSYRCGVVVEPADARALAEVLERLSRDQQSCIDMGARARKMIEDFFSRKLALERWDDVLRNVARR